MNTGLSGLLSGGVFGVASEEDIKIGKDNFIEGVSNEYINGAYPGRETLPSEPFLLDGSKILNERGNVAKAGGGFDLSAIRTDIGTGIPTLITGTTRKTIRDPYDSGNTRYERVPVTYRPQGWSEENGMKNVQIFNVNGQRSIIMAPPGGEGGYYYNIEEYLD